MTAYPKKILVIDDEVPLAKTLATALSYEGYTTFEAHDGEEGLKIAQSEKPDLVILDIMMPKMDGIAVLKRLKEHDDTKDIKVIIMTALDDMNKIAEVLETGGNDYVVKSKIELDSIVAKAKAKLGDS